MHGDMLVMLTVGVAGYDKSVRIWNNKARVEVAKLAHNMPVIAAAWMDRDAGIITLGDNGLVSTWTRSVGVDFALSPDLCV